ncbi:PepSY domain-containing protein [Planococcus sp. X10-3]|uniref:PepSY domain-containing protein n=1 Tax=Planococcus sp. X10-3 TaxID=3061240 RepID=UPI003BAF2403
MKKWIAISIASVVLVIAAVFFLIQSLDTNHMFDEAEATEKVISLYGGEADSATLSGDLIMVEFTNSQGRYRAAVDQNSGEVESLELIEQTGPANNLTEQQAEDIALAEAEGEITATVYSKERNEYEVEITGETQLAIVAISAETGEVRKISTEEIADAEPPEEEPAAEPERIITRDEAVAIARQTLDGELQEVEFIETADGGYYLVEIENDDTDQEATIQIHAIRGETLTVDWDD